MSKEGYISLNIKISIAQQWINALRLMADTEESHEAATLSQIADKLEKIVEVWE